MTEVFSRSVKFTLRDFSIPVSVKPSNKIAAGRPLPSFELATPCCLIHLNFRSGGPRLCSTPPDTADEIIDPDYIPLRAASARKLRRISRLGVAALRAGTVDVHQCVLAAPPVPHPPKRPAKRDIRRCTRPRQAGMSRSAPVKRIILFAAFRDK